MLWYFHWDFWDWITYTLIKACHCIQHVSMEKISVRLFFFFLIYGKYSILDHPYFLEQARVLQNSLFVKRAQIMTQHSLYTRKYIALILGPNTMQFDPNSMFPIRNSRQERFYMSTSSARTWKISLGLNEDAG